MKFYFMKIKLLSVFMFIATAFVAQVPALIQYQAVARDGAVSTNYMTTRLKKTFKNGHGIQNLYRPFFY